MILLKVDFRIRLCFWEGASVFLSCSLSLLRYHAPNTANGLVLAYTRVLDETAYPASRLAKSVPPFAARAAAAENLSGVGRARGPV